MQTNFKKAILPTVIFISMLGAAAVSAAAPTAVTVNLVAQRASTSLPDGTSVPMWAFCTNDTNTIADPSYTGTGVAPQIANPALGGGTVNGGACGGGWAPGPTIVVPYSADGTSLTVNLTNNLPMPTSLVVLGQYGGGLGAPLKMNGPTHTGQNFTTFPGNGAADIPFTPPAQAQRVKSFATEVPANNTTPAVLSWNNLKPGTYIYETGTLPSIQAPMGLYGVLVVTQGPVSSATLTPGKAYPGKLNEVAYDSDAALLFSEIDPVQNNAVDAAALAGTDVNMRFNDPACVPNCYPAAVNYTPTYFLINGKAFDKTNPLLSSFAVPGTYSSGNVLLRLLNAGLRTHIPSVVGLGASIVAEDGNVAPGNPKLQNEVLLPAGKTHDVLVSPGVGADGKYAPANFAVFDRALSLTSANQPDSGMQGFLLVNGAATPAAVTPVAVADTFSVPFNSSNMTIGNVLFNDIGISHPLAISLPGGLVLDSSTGNLHATTAITAPLTFQYCGNGSATLCANVTVNPTGAGGPVAKDDVYTSPAVGTYRQIAAGVLANDTEPNGLKLTVDTTSVVPTGCNVTVNTDGSFLATEPVGGTTCTFTYKVKNAVGVVSATAATVTVNFPAAGSNLTVVLVDAKNNSEAITDYRWIIQEDLTFKHDTSATPSLSTRTLGTSFHKSHMPVIATGCVGPISCGSGQTGRTDASGARHVVTDSEALALQSMPGDVALDPTKNYYISVLPGDAQNPVTVGTCADPSITNPSDPNYCDPAGKGHMMGGTEIKPATIASAGTVTIKLQATPLEPAQLSVFIYEDNAPTNNQNDLNEAGLGGFSIILMDPAGRVGDVAGQQTFDAFNMPLTNALLGTPGCPNELNKATAAATGNNLVGVVYTCPNAPVRVAPRRADFPAGNAGRQQYLAALAAYQQLLASDPVTYALAGHALIKNLTPARYDVLAHPDAAREGAGEVWWQTETLEGTPAQDAFVGIKEPRYFQEFGPPGFHTTIGFVNPKHVSDYAKANGLTGPNTITGKVTSQHMSHPSDVTLYDSGSYDLLSSTTCQVALNSQGGTGPTIATAQCDQDGNFTFSGVPAGAYEVAIWDQWLDQIIQTVAVTVPAVASGTTVAMNDLPVLSWFTQYDQNIFLDNNHNGVYDDGDQGISNALMTSRYRNGSIHMQTATDSSGNGLLAEMFPLFNWYVVEADTTRFKQTSVNVTVDGGGAVDTSGPGAGLWASTYPTGESSVRTEFPGAYSYGLQSFISQRNKIDWGRAPYVVGENGGIQGTVVYSSTRPFDDQRYNVQNIWAPLVPRVTVNLYQRVKLPDGTIALNLVDTTQTSSWDDWVNALNPDGTQKNMKCPGQLATDPFVNYTLAAQNPGGDPDITRCYDGFHNWNQAQAAPYDGRYNFPSAAYIAAHPGQIPAGGTLVSLPPGDYVVEAVTPPGYEIVKEEDKNILIGDAFIAPVTQQFGALGSIFILPDQATINNANPYNPGTGDPGFQTNPTSNLGVTASLNSMPECVGNLHRVPDYLSIYPQAQQVAPFAGMDRPLCDRKLVQLGDQMQASANFFVFTSVPVASNNTGIILDDASSEFNAASPDFGEKASVPFVPVSVKDFNGLEMARTYSDQWGAYNMMTPSSWLVNPPTPSGYGPNMLITCMNDPGPIPDPTGATDSSGKVRMITDPQYNPAYSNFCYTNPFMPGLTTYLDTPVLPIAAFAAGYNPTDCAYPDATPAISRVDSSVGFGPYLPKAGGSLTIAALGDQQVQNPAYAGPFATSGPASQRTITRHYGFGSRGPGSKVTLGGVPLNITGWSDASITVDVPANTATGELVITADNGKSSVDAVTVTVEDAAPKRVQGASGQTIQAAIEAASPGDLILVDAGTYNELVIMWKPVRLQGVGAASVIINAAKYPNAKLDGWRTRINQLFSIDGTTGNQTGTAQVDPLPTQEITGGVVLLEPSVLGTEEGAGITVLAKNLPATQCSNGANSTVGSPITDSNFLCKPSRIDGVSVTGGDAGGGIYVNGWAHGLEIANNRVYGNAGALHGGIRVGVPYLELTSLPTRGNDDVVVVNGEIAGFGFDEDVKIHHNAITKNGTVEGPAGNGGAGGGVSICTGTDGYSVDHNWICGNISASDGGGIGHIGFSQAGRITNNTILFNQSFQQTNSTQGGGIAVIGEPAVGGTVSLGTGNLTIDSNLIRGNFAESGNGGGIRLQQVNGADVEAFPNNTGRWFAVTVTNNMVVDNVAGYAGGGVSLSDTLVSIVDNNTIASNDSVGIAGVILTHPNGTADQSGTGTPSPAGISSDLTSAALLGVMPNSRRNANKASIPSGFMNNILWKNRSFFYKAVAGQSALCSSNNAADAAGTTCNQLLDQATTGQCTNTSAGAPAYWDLGVVGDPNSMPGPTVTNITAATQTIAVTVNLTSNLPAGFNTPGQQYNVTIKTGTGATCTGGAFTGTGCVDYTGTRLATVVDGNTFTFVPGNIGHVPMPSLGSSANRTVTLPNSAVITIASGGSAPTQAITVAVTTSAPHAITSGQSVTISGFTGTGSASYNGSHIATVTGTTTFTYSPSGSGAAPIPGNGAVWTVTAPWANPTLSPTYSVLTSTASYTGNGNTQNDPLLLDMYCNGSRVTPEYGTVINPPSVLNLQVAATVDEGNNYVNLRYGPLYLSKPGNVAFGDYHIQPGSSGADAGTTISMITNDFDGDVRPQGTAYDIGADELPGPPTASFTSATLGTLSTMNGQPRLAFGNLSGLRSSTVTISVAGTGPVSFGAATVTNGTGTAFSKGADTCSGQTVAVGNTCTITVNFNAPTSNSNRTGTLNVPNSGAGVPTLSLTGS